MADAERCVGFMDALGQGVARIHRLFNAAFPDLTYPINDLDTAKKYFAMQHVLGPNVCMPPNSLTQDILARIVVAYAREKPTELTFDTFDFASSALAAAYPCSNGNK
jgi:hypothetical protein